MIEADVTLQSLYVDTATVRTSNSPITGSFNTSTSLHLETSNARINVEAGLTNENSGRPTDLLLKTSNGFVTYLLLACHHSLLNNTSLQPNRLLCQPLLRK